VLAEVLAVALADALTVTLAEVALVELT